MTRSALAKIAYGALFCVALPVGLLLWARRLDALQFLPALDPLPGMWLVAAAGVALMVWAMIALWVHAGGLPMNAFPPPRLTLHGPYALLSHPIYVGFVLTVAGVACALGSAAGALVVAPVCAVACAALALGYEEHDLDRRFGCGRPRPWLTLPRTDGAGAGATPSERWRVTMIVFGWWLIGYEIVGHLPVPDAIELMRGNEARWPVIMPWVAIYSLAYPLPIAAVLGTKDRGALAMWARDALFGVALGLLIMLALPFIASLRPYDHLSPFAWLMELNRSDGVGGRAAFPSFHVYWAFMAAALLCRRNALLGAAGLALAVLIALSCALAGMHAVLDTFAGALLALLSLQRARLWRGACALAERVANGWWEWRVGPLRLLVHGLYAGLAAGVGVLLISAFDAAASPWSIAAVAAASLVGAGVWGQMLVGSKVLQRPFGYFGSVGGVLIAGACLATAGVQVWPLLAATAAAAPWVQALGRLRCLVQGCCHGAPIVWHASGALGIIYRLPQSRVAAVSHLKDTPLHPTPLYSIMCNCVIGVLAARLCVLGAPASMVVGAYLVLQGAARFVEESYRGEAQTQHACGLRIYQWCAVTSMALGAALTCLPSQAVCQPAWPGTIALLAAALVALAHGMAMGVDAPECTWRMSRLTPQA